MKLVNKKVVKNNTKIHSNTPQNQSQVQKLAHLKEFLLLVLHELVGSELA